MIFDAEHFFDGYAGWIPSMPWLTLRAALQGGAEILCLCDTNGAAYPADIARDDQGGSGGLSRRLYRHPLP